MKRGTPEAREPHAPVQPVGSDVDIAATPGVVPSPRWALLGPLLASTLVAVSVVGPLTTKGYLLLLDWAPGRHPRIPRSIFGLDGGTLSGAPLSVLIAAVVRVSPSPEIVGWLPLALFFPLAGLGMACLLPGGALERTAGALLYCVNPLVLDRAFAGHFGFLLGYALLPFATRSMLRGMAARGGRRWLPALWIAGMTALSPHFAWIAGVLVMSMVIVHPHRGQALRWAGGMLGAAALANAYIVSTLVGAVSTIDVGARDLMSYRTRGGPGAGLFVNAAGLGGFWRGEPRLVADRPAGWPATLAAILLVVMVGIWVSRRRPDIRQLARALAVAGGAGFFLAMGDRGPTGWLFAWMFTHLPGFTVMREPQKFVALLALAYAAFFGAGVTALVGTLSSSWRRSAAVAALIAAPLLWTPSLLGGLGGAVRPSRYPGSWYEADAVMGAAGPGKVLILPWHEYTSFPFTDGRVVHAPAASFFRRDTIIGDNVELPGLATTSTSLRSKYLEFLFAQSAATDSFGELVAPLGIEYVLVSRVREQERYDWVRHQRDLVPVLTRDDLVLYRNTHLVAPEVAVWGNIEVEDWGEVIGLAGAEDLEGRAVSVRREEPGPVRAPGSAAVTGTPTASARPTVLRRSPVDFRVLAEPGSYLIVSEPFEPAWRLGRTRPDELAGGVMGFSVGSGRERLWYGRWTQVRSGYVISVATVLGLAGLAVLGRRSPPSAPSFPPGPHGRP